jgi:aryl-alcohol dehydrogenase-like predicted oxidoreductase
LGVAPAANQLCYSLLSRAIEFEVLPFCRAHGVGVIAYLALMQGLLTGKYRTLDEVPPLHRRTRHFDGRQSGTLCRHGEPGAEAEVNAALAAIREIGRESGLSMSDLAIKWAIAQPGMACVLAGCRTPQRVEENARATAAPLAPEIASRLSAATDVLKAKLGRNCDYWEAAANDRTRSA